MKHLTTILSALALVLVAILFFLHFNHVDKTSKSATGSVQRDSADFKIAYFDIDSLQTHYEYFKDVTNQIKSRENAMTSELSSLRSSFEKKMKEWQQRGANMSQAEGEAAQREYGQMQQRYEQRQMSLEQELQKHRLDMMTDVRKKIETYLQEYNKSKGYAFILSYEPGFMLYYKDSIYDITDDVIEGLNSTYKKK